MKVSKLISLLLIFHVVNAAQAQNKGIAIDSICKTFLLQNKVKKAPLFLKMISQRATNHLTKRIDTIASDYIFIVETIDSKSKKTNCTEYYFKKEDSIPQYYFSDSQFYDPKKIYPNTEFEYYFKLTKYWETLNPMLKKFDTLQPYQTLSYNISIIISHGCIVFKDVEAKQYIEYKNKRKQELQNTYQILTMINKVNHKTIVSFQIPPKSFEFFVERYSVMGDF